MKIVATLAYMIIASVDAASINVDVEKFQKIGEKWAKKAEKFAEWSNK